MRTRGFVLKMEVSDPQVVRVDDLIAHAKEIIETLRLAAVEFEYDGIGYSVDNSGRVLQRCDSSVWTVLREDGGKPPAIVVTDPRNEALRVAAEALEEVRCWVPDGTRRSPLDRGAKVETVYELMNGIDAALAAIRAGGAR